MSVSAENESRFGVVLLHSISSVLRAEKLFKEESIPIKIIPVPRHLSSDCGVCVRFNQEDQRKIEAILAKHHLEIQGIHCI